MPASLYDVLVKGTRISDVTMKTSIENLYMVPSNIHLSGAQVELNRNDDWEFILKRAIAPVRREYDFIIIDSPPNLGLVTVNSLTATDTVLIPLQSEFYALEGMSELLDTITRVQMFLNPKLVLEGVFLNMYSKQTQLSQMVLKEVEDYFDDLAYDTHIPRNVSIAESPSFGQPVLLYAPWSKGAQSFTTLAVELISRNRGAPMFPKAPDKGLPGREKSRGDDKPDNRGGSPKRNNGVVLKRKKKKP